MEVTTLRNNESPYVIKLNVQERKGVGPKQLISWELSVHFIAIRFGRSKTFGLTYPQSVC